MKRSIPIECPECGTAMDYKATLEPGDEEGRNARHLYQCPTCKTIEARPY